MTTARLHDVSEDHLPATGAGDHTRLWRALAWLLPLSLAAYAILLHASIGRPIWIDEFLHFALGARPSAADAWSIIRTSIAGVNHGQTGVYMFIDYLLLSASGASAFSLRLPSVLSGVLLFGSFIILFRTLKLSLFWRIVGIIALFGQGATMYFIGEARPYMPLAAASLAILAYYMFPLDQRQRPVVRLFGVFSTLFGVTLHPYFALYWAALCALGYAHHCMSGESKLGIRPLLAYIDAPLCAAGAAVYFVLASYTWLASSQTFSFDPFQWIGTPSVIEHAAGFHFEFVHQHFGLVTAGTALAMLIIAALPSRTRGSLLPVVSPLLLIAIAIGLSLLIGYISYLRSYWILPRQWVASSTLVAVATVWLWAEIARIASRAAPIAGYVVGALALLAVAGHALDVHASKSRELVAAMQAPGATPTVAECSTQGLQPPLGTDIQKNNDTWTDLANRNVACGGGVWSVFRYYYGDSR